MIGAAKQQCCGVLVPVVSRLDARSGVVHVESGLTSAGLGAARASRKALLLYSYRRSETIHATTPFRARSRCLGRGSTTVAEVPGA